MELRRLSVHDMHMRYSAGKRFPKKTPYEPTNMRAWREAKGKTLERVAARIGITYNQLSKIERGVSPYSQRILEIAADEYGCTVQDLLTRVPGEAEHLFSLWNKMDERERRRLARFVTSAEDDK